MLEFLLMNKKGRWLVLKELMDRLSSIRLFAWLAGLIALTAASGAFLAQDAPRAWYEEALGAAAAPVLALGVDHVYRTPFFVLLLFALAANLAVCTLRRWRKAGWASRGMHAGFLLLLAGAFLRAAAGARGRLPLELGRPARLVLSTLEDETVAVLPFEVRLEEFKVESDSPQRHVLLVDHDGARERAELFEGQETVFPRLGLTVRPLRIVADFVMGARGEVRERSQTASNPAVQLELGWEGRRWRGWFFERFPGMQAQAAPFSLFYRREGGHPRDFVSEVSFLFPGAPPVRARLGVNSPVRQGGWTFYQSGYEPGRDDRSILLAVKDPGITLAYLGLAAIILAMAGWLWRS
ncbi:MAG TPA: hypothetical protein DEB40_02385 [Elusimicrobia bacterium]|nr:hypothetical protein [Elusimicrobiota bacterium]HBT60578.1 hypothetical protein [Elusimicrobiota bacterium]